jgi:hypothetical protein
MSLSLSELRTAGLTATAQRRIVLGAVEGRERRSFTTRCGWTPSTPSAAICQGRLPIPPTRGRLGGVVEVPQIDLVVISARACEG